MRASRLTDRIGYHLEGPIWWERTDELRLVDMLAGDVLTLQGDQVTARIPLGSPIAACLRPRVGGGAVLATERAVCLASREDLADLEPIYEIQSDSSVRNNEGGCDPLGRFFIGTMAYDAAGGAGALYRVDPGSQSPVTIEPSATISNGIDWSPDGRLAYWNDTPTGTVTVFDVDSAGELHNGREFFAFPEGAGGPDGLTVDAEGGVWAAGYGGAAVLRIDPEGKLSEWVDVGAGQVTAVTFAGPDFDHLVITTSRENLREGEDPEAGSLFGIYPGVRGKPPLMFAG